MAAPETEAAQEAAAMGIIDVIENVSNLIWEGRWGDATLIPLPPMVVILLLLWLAHKKSQINLLMAWSISIRLVATLCPVLSLRKFCKL